MSDHLYTHPYTVARACAHAYSQAPIATPGRITRQAEQDEKSLTVSTISLPITAIVESALFDAIVTVGNNG